MVLSRSRLRLPAAFVVFLLLLTGAGEVLGACYCAHRGGRSMEGHGPAHEMVASASAHSDPAQAEAPSARGHQHGPASHSDAGAGEPDDDGTEDPTGNACRALCALACSTSPGPTPNVTQRAPDLVTCSAAAPAPPVESVDMVPPTARPHVLPLSQAPPTTV